MSRKYENVRKSFVRNTEQPLKALNPKVDTCTNDGKAKHSKVRFTMPARLPDAVPSASRSENKFTKPELHTTLKIRQKMEAEEKEKAKKVDVNPSVLLSAKDEISKKLNFGLHEKVFKDLVPVNVNDSVLAQERPSRKRHSVRTPRDPVPKLEEFLKPIEPLNYPLPFMRTQEKIEPPKRDLKKENQALHREYLRMMNHFDLLN